MSPERRLDAAIDIARAERESLRWVLLTALWHARPYGANEMLLTACAADIPLPATAAGIRRELGWLESHGLARVDRAGPVWAASLTAMGEDVYEYRAEAPAGLARPPRW
jgi:hypothetical protein